MHVYICIETCTYAYTCICINMIYRRDLPASCHMNICIYIYLFIYVYTYTFTFICEYVYMCIHINNRCSLPAPATHGMALSKFGQRMHSCHRCCFLAGCSTYCKTYIHILLYIYILCYVYTHQPFRNPNIFCYVNKYQVISYSVYVHCFT